MPSISQFKEQTKGQALNEPSSGSHFPPSAALRSRRSSPAPRPTPRRYADGFDGHAVNQPPVRKSCRTRPNSSSQSSQFFSRSMRLLRVHWHASRKSGSLGSGDIATAYHHGIPQTHRRHPVNRGLSQRCSRSNSALRSWHHFP